MISRRGADIYSDRIYPYPSSANKQRIASLANSLLDAGAAHAVLTLKGWTLFLNQCAGQAYATRAELRLTHSKGKDCNKHKVRLGPFSIWIIYKSNLNRYTIGPALIINKRSRIARWNIGPSLRIVMEWKRPDKEQEKA